MSSLPPSGPGPCGEGVSTEVFAAQKALLDRLAACERKYAELYEHYAHAFPGTSDFWSALAADETSHAAMLGTMTRFLDKGQYFTNIGSLAKGVDDAVAELTREIFRVRAGLVTEEQAFNHAIGFEARLTDGHFYDVVQCGAPDFVRMATVLRKGAEHHRDKIRDRMLRRRAEGRDSWTG